MQYLIASLKHTHKDHEHITWWSLNHCGYTPVLGDRVGKYCFGEAMSLNDGFDHIAVPLPAVMALALPEPLWKLPDARMYDQRGPVVINSKANWQKLALASINDGRQVVAIKCEPFRGKARSIYPDEQTT